MDIVRIDLKVENSFFNITICYKYLIQTSRHSLVPEWLVLKILSVLSLT